MSVARIISQACESSSELANDLRSRGFTVQSVVPGELRAGVADLEVTVRECTSEEALSLAAQVSGQKDMCVFVAPRAVAGNVRTIEMFVLRPTPTKVLEFPAALAAPLSVGVEPSNSVPETSPPVVSAPLAIVMDSTTETRLPGEPAGESPRTILDIVEAVVSRNLSVAGKGEKPGPQNEQTVETKTEPEAPVSVAAQVAPYEQSFQSKMARGLRSLPAVSPAPALPQSIMASLRPVVVPKQQIQQPARSAIASRLMARVRSSIASQPRFFGAVMIFAAASVLALLALILVYRFSPSPVGTQVPSSSENQPVPFHSSRPVNPPAVSFSAPIQSSTLTLAAPLPAKSAATVADPFAAKTTPVNPVLVQPASDKPTPAKPAPAKTAKRQSIPESDFVAKDTVVHVNNSQSNAQKD